jgi:hypothetical protein
VGYLYKLDFASGKSYVGITTGKLSYRISQHRCSAAADGQLPVHRAWRKHGEPTVTVLAIAAGDYLLEIEKRAVEAYGTFGDGGYNASPGGDLVPVMTPEIRQKIRVAATGRIASPEARAKMSARSLGRPKSAEMRAKLAAAKRGMPRSEETKRSISAAKTGKKMSAEFKQKVSARMAGVPKSAEHKQKNAEAHRIQQWHTMAWACGVRVGRQRQLDLDGGAA